MKMQLFGNDVIFRHGMSISVR